MTETRTERTADDRWIEVEFGGEVRRFGNATLASRALGLSSGSLHSAMRARRGFLNARDGRRMALRYEFGGGPVQMEDGRGKSQPNRQTVTVAIDRVWYGSPSEASRETGIPISTITRAISRKARIITPRGGLSRMIEVGERRSWT